MGKPLSPHLQPPAGNGLGGERRRVVVDANAHPALVVGEVEHAIRDGLAFGLVQEIVDPHLQGLAGASPFPTNSFFLVSTEMTGWPRFWNASTRSLIC